MNESDKHGMKQFTVNEKTLPLRYMMSAHLVDAYINAHDDTDPMPYMAIEAVRRVMTGDGMKHGARAYVDKCGDLVCRWMYLSKAQKHAGAAGAFGIGIDTDSHEYHLAHAAARILCVLEAILMTDGTTRAECNTPRDNTPEV